MKNKLKILVVIFILIIPLVFILYKTIDSADKTKEKKSSTNSKSNIKLLEEQVNTNPNYNNLINLSVAYINNKLPGKSIDYLVKALKLKPQSAVAYNNLGVAYIMMQQYDDGIKACEMALMIDSTFQLAKNNLKWGMDERNKILSTIIKQEEIPVDKRDNSFYISYGLNYFKIGKFDESINIWNKLLETDPNNLSALNNIGSALIMKNKYDEAINIFNRIIKLDPNNQLAKNNLNWAIGDKAKFNSIAK